MKKESLTEKLDRIQHAGQTRRKAKHEDRQFLLSLGDNDQYSLPLACAVLLSDVAQIDGNFDFSERRYLYRVLESELGLSSFEAEEVVKQAKSILASGRGSSSYAEYAKKEFSLEQRQKIFRLVQGMVAADSVTDDFEKYIEFRIKAALGL